MYHIYHTPGFVIASRPRGEANRQFDILTRDLGLIRASAQGVRYLKSKLRYNLQDFSVCDFSLVRGKESWRITSALLLDDIYRDFKQTPEAAALFGRVFKLLDRLLRGEEKNEPIFGALEAAHRFLREENSTSEAVRNCEYITVLRLLYHLGYLALSPDLEEFTRSPYLDRALVSRMGTVRHRALTEINRSLKESQL